MRRGREREALVLITQIRTHVLKNKVDVLVVISLHNLQEMDDVVVLAQLLQKDNLTIGTLRIGCVLKGVKDLFQSNSGLCLLVNRLPHDAVGLIQSAQAAKGTLTYSFAELLDDLVLLCHVLVNRGNIFVDRHCVCNCG